jgi:UDP-glucose 4-epimerase
VYGSRQSSSACVISISFRRLSRGLRPIIHGEGKQTGDFVHVSDVVRANLFALEAERGLGEAFNVGTGRESSIRMVVRTLAKARSMTSNPSSQVLEKEMLREVLLISASHEKYLVSKRRLTFELDLMCWSLADDTCLRKGGLKLLQNVPYFIF